MNVQRQQTPHCYCYLGTCNYFSSRDLLALSWADSKQFCSCLGGRLVRLVEQDSMYIEQSYFW